ncbi:MAG: DUF2934 domain-containing protein [Nitrospirae bacterium]|nr:DUF2934 domain-containing protein [Nitrospirota bacterium]
MKDEDLYSEIAKIASELYEKSGRIEGRDLENWLEAEKIVKSKYRGEERREYERHPFKKVIRYSPFYLSEKSFKISHEGIIVDISKKGLGMITDIPLEKGSILFFDPDIVLNDSIAIVSTVKWASEVEKDLYRVGLKIYTKELFTADY